MLLKLLIILLIIFVFVLSTTFLEEVRSKRKTFKEVYANQKNILWKASVYFLIFLIASLIHMYFQATGTSDPQLTQEVVPSSYVNTVKLLLLLIFGSFLIVYATFLKELFIHKKSFKAVYNERKKGFLITTILYIIFLVGSIYEMFGK